jgi:hypothetical protein
MCNHDSLCSIINNWLEDFNRRYKSIAYIKSQLIFIQIDGRNIQIANITDNGVAIMDQQKIYLNIYYYQPELGFFSTLEAAILERIDYYTDNSDRNSI